MKKRLILLSSVLMLAFSVACAQSSDIIYRDFDPDSILVITNSGVMFIDLDGYNQPDIRMSYYITSPAVFPYIESCYPDSISLCVTEPDGILSEIEEWTSILDFEIVLASHHYGFRIKHDNRYIYGWFETYLEWDTPKDRRTVYWGFDRVAYCTIPNYPLRWGQTSLTGVEENEASAFAVVHPNPTTGLVAITGENLKQAEAFNTLGQKVLNAQGEGNELHIDMVALPAGIYFVNVTDEEGRRCVRKVVKQ